MSNCSSCGSYTVSCSVSKTFGLTDADNRLFLVCAPGPDTKDWPQVTSDFVAADLDAKSQIRFPKEEDRRGPFKTVTYGVSFGGGQQV